MRTKHTTLAVAVVLLTLGCRMALQPTIDDRPVVLSITAATNLGARTVLPAMPTITSYVLTGKLSSDAEFAELATFASPLTGATVAVNAGTWDFTLTARDATSDLLQGNLTSVSVSATSATALSFTLTPLSAGTGSFTLTITLPVGHAVTSVTASVGGVAIDPAPSVVGVAGTDTVVVAQSGLTRGGYLVSTALKDAAGKTRIVLSEWVRVEPNLTSEKSVAPALADFNAPPTAPSGLSATHVAGTAAAGVVDLAWTEASNNETGFVITWTDDEATPNTGTLNAGAGSNSYRWDAAVRGRTYSFTIIATNDFGDSTAAATGGSTAIPLLCTAAFNSDGGSAVAPQDVEVGGLVTEPATPPEKTGYSFGGWYANSGLTDAWVFASETVAGDATLYAKWTLATYSITYNLDGGTNSLSNPSSYTMESDRIVLLKPTKTDSVFDAWYTETTFETSISDIPAGSTGDVAVYAKWRDPIEEGQENQPGGAVDIPAVPVAKAYWLAPYVNDGSWDVGDIGAFGEGATMTTADEDGLDTIAAPVTPGTYYLYYVVRDTKEILSISPNYLTVVADNVPFYYMGTAYSAFHDQVDADNYKTTVESTDFFTPWATVGTAKFSNELDTAGVSYATPNVMIDKLTGTPWVVTICESPTQADAWVSQTEIYKYVGGTWTRTASLLLTDQHWGIWHTQPNASIITSDGSAMYLALQSWETDGSWPTRFQKRTGVDFNSVSGYIDDWTVSNLQIGGDYLYTLSRTNEFTDHTEMTAHAGITVERYDLGSGTFSRGDFTQLGDAGFNKAGDTPHFAFRPAMYVNGEAPYVVFVEPTTYEHARHNAGSPSWHYYGWNDRFTDPKLTVMRYDGSAWVVVGDALFSPVVYKTTATSYIAGSTTTVRTGTNYDADADFETTDTVYTPGICVGGGRVFVVGQDASDDAFICEFDGTSWSTVRTAFASGVRDPKMVYDNGKVYIVYTKADGSGTGSYIYTP